MNLPLTLHVNGTNYDLSLDTRTTLLDTLYAFALVSIAAAIDVVDGVIRDVRLAFGGVAPVPWRARKAEAVLRGTQATEDSFRQAADAELAQAQPLRENAFKVPLARNLLVRTLLDLIQEEK